MAGSIWGTLLTMTTWGESHGKGIGVVVDGCPAGLSLCEEDIQEYLDRRKPGQNRFTTKRREGDAVEILSGVFEGKTTGTPVSLLVRNTDQRSRDYDDIKDLYRPGHADFTFDQKYGFRDYRGGGRSSGRETIGRVAAALVTTFYGCILANLIFGPISKKLRIRNDEEVIYKQVIIEGVVGIQAGDNPKVLKEKLVSLLHQTSQQKILNGEEGGGGKKEKKSKKEK